MSEVKIIDVHQSVYALNDRIAETTREYMKQEKKFLLNLMASPGAGKTKTLLALGKALRKQYQIGVIEADIDASVDAQKMKEAGISTIQVHTGGQCAMDAQMTKEALENFDISDLDILILENVGNLVCPAETDTGAVKNAVILSVPEGDDKPLKYPLMFEKCDLLIVNKMDTLKYFNFDMDRVVHNAKLRNPQIEIIFLSAKTGEGMDTFAAWIEQSVEEWKH